MLDFGNFTLLNNNTISRTFMNQGTNDHLVTNLAHTYHFNIL